MNRNLSPAILAMVSSLFCSAAAADVYRWTDIDGNVHFGDRPQYVDEPIEVKTADIGDPDDAPDTAAPDTADADAAALEARAENCEVASKRLAEYERADQLVGEDEYGRKRDIIGEERVEVLLRAQKDVEEFCGEVAESEPSEPAPVKPPPTAAEAAKPPEEAPLEPEQAPAAAAIGEGGSLSAY